jgi:putative ABC transport system substrate-binding protein
MIGRREFIAMLGGVAAWPLAARAQQDDRMRRIGLLMNGSAGSTMDELLGGFRQGMKDLGHVEGRNFALEVRYANGDPAQMPTLAADLVDQKVDVIVVGTAAATLAVSKMTSSVPIVQAGGADPVRSSGVAESLAKPKGNVTGLTNQSEDLTGKLLELLLTINPRASRVGVIFAQDGPVTELSLAAIKHAASVLAVTLHSVGLSDANSFDQAVLALPREGVGGIVVLSGARLQNLSRQIVTRIADIALPAVYPYRYYVADGGLMSYGVSQRENHRQAARFVDRILKGARPADLPIEQPTKFELIINLKTAKTQGLEIPPILLARADEVIE